MNEVARVLAAVSSGKDPLVILGVKDNASVQEIRTKYKVRFSALEHLGSSEGEER